MVQKSNLSGLRRERRFKGRPLSPGVAIGRPCLYVQSRNAERIVDAPDQVSERQRLGESIAWLARRLDALAVEAHDKLGPEQADIFRSLRMILEDDILQARFFELIEDYGLSAEEAVERELNRYQDQLQKARSDYLRERSEDIGDIRRELLGRLGAARSHRVCRDSTYCEIGHCPLANDHIATVSELTPNLVIETNRHTRGLLAQSGGVNSHAAILARALRLPAVSGLQNIHRQIPPDADLVINGDTGEVIVNPSRETISRLTRQAANAGSGLAIHPPVAGLRVLATLDTAQGLEAALKVRAEGIGLYRTEMEALRSGRLPSEEDQENRYAKVVGAMAPAPVYIRLFDFGDDKTLARKDTPSGRVGASGLRGAQYLLAHPELLRSQARAMARASVNGTIRVTYPMISDVEQFQRLRQAFEQAVADLPASALLHGVMLEVPSACLQAQRMLEEADFGCVGTNDLVQYLFGQSRTGQGASNRAWCEHPVLWDLMEAMAAASRRTGKPLSVCGELACEPRFVSRAMDIGINTISTNPADVAGIRRSLGGH